MVDPTIIGVESERITYEIEKGAIRKFAEAIGEENPVYFDEQAAKEQGYPSLLAPITFPTTFRDYVPDWFNKLDRNRLLHGEQKYTYYERLFAKDIVEVTDTVVDVFEKEGSNGKMTFIVRKRKGYKNDKLAFEEQMTLIIRGGE